MSQLPLAICIMGPTAAGKTELAIQLKEVLPVDLISVDSALVYKDMTIGTAKPSVEELAKAPHRLIDFLDPAEAYSAAKFRDDALREMTEITAAGKIPLLVGGTMLYFRALLYGLSDLPAADEATRAELVAETREKGLEAMHAQLAEVDPLAAQRIHPNDPQRIQRALEVHRITGMSLSDWQAQPGEALNYKTALVGLVPSDRAVLHERIVSRFKGMLDRGLVDEVRALHDRGDLHIDMPSMRAVGYRQVWQYLEGAFSYDEMLERGIIATRQLAKRQMTWLRGMPEVKIFDCLNNDLANEVLKLVADARMN